MAGLLQGVLLPHVLATNPLFKGLKKTLGENPFSGIIIRHVQVEIASWLERAVDIGDAPAVFRNMLQDIDAVDKVVDLFIVHGQQIAVFQVQIWRTLFDKVCLEIVTYNVKVGIAPSKLQCIMTRATTSIEHGFEIIYWQPAYLTPEVEAADIVANVDRI